MQAFILAGGLGTRLRSIVNDRPKPLAPIGTTPFLEHQIEFLKARGIREFVFCVGYLHEHIQTYFENGRQWGVSIKYSIEEDRLGTAGALKNAERFVNGPFLVLNGDTFFDLDVAAFIEAHRENTDANPACLATMALTTVPDPRSYGSVITDDDGRILSFHEKSESLEASPWISAGVYAIEPQLLDFIPPLLAVSIEKETFPQLLRSGYELFGYRTDGFFVDIGTPAGYHRFRSYVGDPTT